ncbi:MAG: hypothetical protein ACK5Q5_24920, partial [Planctomycetaceae bacterium]
TCLRQMQSGALQQFVGGLLVSCRTLNLCITRLALAGHGDFLIPKNRPCFFSLQHHRNVNFTDSQRRR